MGVSTVAVRNAKVGVVAAEIAEKVENPIDTEAHPSSLKTCHGQVLNVGIIGDSETKQPNVSNHVHILSQTQVDLPMRETKTPATGDDA